MRAIIVLAEQACGGGVCGRRACGRDAAAAAACARASLLAKPPCLVQSTVRPRPVPADSSPSPGRRNKYHDEWDSLEVWGLGRTSWKECISAKPNAANQEFDARPFPRASPDSGPPRPKLKVSLPDHFQGLRFLYLKWSEELTC